MFSITNSFLSGRYHIGKYDAEYQRILQELQRLGIAPSGDKSIDKAKLENAKAELINKIQQRQADKEKFETNFETILPVESVENLQRSEMEEQRLGAMNIAELNRLYFNI